MVRQELEEAAGWVRTLQGGEGNSGVEARLAGSQERRALLWRATTWRRRRLETLALVKLALTCSEGRHFKLLLSTWAESREGRRWSSCSFVWMCEELA